ncbi:MAG: hypothetical protein M1276_00550 [Deltaproteobacteria bacterium]|jgi:hypothetical protein|nr:hypothetical protein [Deltaproteobacteria bacterium]
MTKKDMLFVFFLAFLLGGLFGIAIMISFAPSTTADSVKTPASSFGGKIVLRNTTDPVEKIIDDAVLKGKPMKNAPVWKLNLLAPVSFKIYREFKRKNITVMVHNDSKSILIMYYGISKTTANVKKEESALKNNIGPAIAAAGYKVAIANLHAPGVRGFIYASGKQKVLPSPNEFSYELQIP